MVGNYAYVADWDSGLQIINISNPNAPVLAESYDTSGLAYEVEVVGNYAYVADGEGGLKILDVSDFTRTLDVQWTRLLGSSGQDEANGIAIASDGSVYVTGDTPNNGSLDAFISKYTSNGSQVWTQLLGGEEEDSANTIATGSDGNIYIAGYSWGGDLVGWINQGQSDAFRAVYDSDGNKIRVGWVFSPSQDTAYGITTGSDGNVYMTGASNSNNHFFIVQYTSDSVGWLLSNPRWVGEPPVLPVHLQSVSLGLGVTVGSDGHIYATGGVSEEGGVFPDFDTFISQFTDDGTHNWTQILAFSGGNSAAYGITTGSDGSIYITGITSGYLNGQSNSGGFDVFITKYTSSGSQVWTQLLGSIGDDSATSITMGSDGSIYITGTTNGNLDGYTNNGLTDAFIAKYNSDGTKVWTQLFGSSGNDYATGITTDSDGSLYLTGYTTGNLNGQTNSGGSDGFIIKLMDTTIS